MTMELGPVLHIGDSEVRVGHLLVDRQDADPGRHVVPEEDDDRGRAACVLRRAVLGGRGGQHVLPAAVAGANRRLGGTQPRRVPHERQGVLADDGPSHQAGDVVGRHPGGDRTGSHGQGQRVPEAPARRRARRGVVPVRRRDEAAARQREARRGVAAVPQWFTPKRDNRDELARPASDSATCRSWWSSGRRCGSGRTTSTARSAGSPITTSGSSSSTRRR